MEIISSWWTYEVRLLPMLLALGIFTGIHLLRKITKIEYTPSYFAVFPFSMLEGQLAHYFGEYMTGEYLSIKDGRKINPRLYIRAWVSMFLTFLLVPLLSGLVIAFILSPEEFVGFLSLLMFWEGLRCLSAIYDFSQYRYDIGSATGYFFVFYGFYLLVLWIVIRFSFRFASPFALTHDYAALFTALETELGPMLIVGIGIAIGTNLLAHLLVNKDSLMPTWSHSSVHETDDEEDDDD